jgi:hypothetical protein
VRSLSEAALREDPRDRHAWTLLATARFVTDDPDGALEAWNHAGEPTVDLIRVDGLGRTRQRVVEDVIDLPRGSLLTPTELRRAQRAAAELPAMSSAAVTYAPAGRGTAEVRVAVSERRTLPSGAVALGAFAVRAAATREIELGIASPSGGGERLTAGWRFWPGRPRYSLALSSPGPWGGIWQVRGESERQPFTGGFETSDRMTGELALSRWEPGGVRWSIAGALDRWRELGAFGSAGGTLRYVSPGDRVAIDGTARWWFGARRFSTWQVGGLATTSVGRQGRVWLARGAIGGASSAAPPLLWMGGDTGHVRPLLLRAHPLLDDGHLRSDRLGRLALAATAEGQWWLGSGLIRLAPAAFIDAGRTARTLRLHAIRDVDVGIGLRVAAPGRAGLLRVDWARGLRDGATAISLVYAP